MAYLVTNNTFNPYSFDEMVKPLNMYKQAYDQAMNQYDSLGQLAGEWEKLGKEDPQSNAYKNYQAYMKGLDEAANDLSSNGLNSNVRNRIRGLNQSYKQTINPIAEAWQRREVARAAQKDALLKNPELFFERDLTNPEQAGIDKFIADTGYGYGQTVNGAMIRTNVQNRMAALAKELRGVNQNGEKTFASTATGANVKSELQKVLPYQYRILQEHGFSSDDIQKYLNGTLNDGAIKDVLDSVVESEVNASGIRGGEFSQTQRDRAVDIAKSGLWAGVGQSNWQYLTDNYGMQASLQDRKRKQDKADAEAAKMGEPSRTARTHGIYVNAADGQLNKSLEAEWRKQNPDKAAAIDRMNAGNTYKVQEYGNAKWYGPGAGPSGVYYKDPKYRVEENIVDEATIKGYQKELNDFAAPTDGKISLGDQLESRYSGTAAKDLISAIKSRGSDLYEILNRDIDNHKYVIDERKGARADLDNIDESASVYYYTDVYGNDMLQYTDKKGKTHNIAIGDSIFNDQYDKMRADYAQQMAATYSMDDPDEMAAMQRRIMLNYQDNMERLRGIRTNTNDTDLTESERKKSGVWN